MRKGVLRLAIQKSGRLSEKSQSLLSRSGIRFDSAAKGLYAPAYDFPLDVMFVRDDDIPEYVRDGVCDLGIVGENVVAEKTPTAGAESLRVVKQLGFSRCRLSLALPEEQFYDGPASLAGKKIATSYPTILGRYLSQAGVQAEPVVIAGSVEIAPRIGVADAICDLVSTGETLRTNGLREVATIFESQAVLVASAATLGEEKDEIVRRLVARIDGVLKAERSKYIMMNARRSDVQRITAILPGMEQPTIMPLGDESDRVAIHAVADENVFWETMEKLKAAGASSILVVPIEKIIE